MAQNKILLDSNVYFRLARDLHPLLFREFGDQRYCLYVLPELDKEYAAQPRLQQKFEWAGRPEYADNRSRTLSTSRKQKHAIATSWDFIWDFVQSEALSTSRVDVTVLCYGLVLEIPVVTDDPDMGKTAEEFGITLWRSLDLLKLMLDCGEIDISLVRRVVSYWHYNSDLPTGFNADFRRLFRESPPFA